MEFGSIKPFSCDNIDKALLRTEWEKWLRSVKLYLEAEEVDNPKKKRSKLLHLGGPQLQEVAYNLPGAIEEYDETKKNDVFETLVTKLNEHFSPDQNSTFERHLFRTIKPEGGEAFNKFLLRVRQQAAKCAFGTTKNEATEINLKDKLIDSWAPVELKKKLLEKERSLDETIELCRVHEQISTQSTVMSQIHTEPGPSYGHINKIAKKFKPNNECGRCGKTNHKANETVCPARGVKCHRCGTVGHFAAKCRTRVLKRPARPELNANTKRSRNTVNHIEVDDSLEEDKEGQEDTIKTFDCFKVEKDQTAHDAEGKEELIKCRVGGVEITMLIDSGSKVNVLNGKDWETLTKKQAAVWNLNLNTGNTLKPYASGTLQVNSKFQSTISIKGKQEIIATFFVIDGGDVSLVGKDTAKRLGILKLGLNVNTIEQILPFPKVKNVKVKLTIDPTVKAVRQPLRKVPVTVELAVEQKLDEALHREIIEKVNEPSDWVSPIVVIFKPNGDIRICVDMRRANEAIKRENYPLPTFDGFMTKLRNARYFSRLDLVNAYHQLELDEESRPITTFITHKGMFRYKRLLFGVNSAPEIFQRIFEGLLSPCENCLNYLDDIIVYGGTEEEHDAHLEKVLNVLRDNNVVLNEAKCVTKVQNLEFLGHKLSANGIEAGEDKVKTILEFRPPHSKEEVRSFLGLVTYLGKFIPDLGSITEPLRQLVKRDAKFTWTPNHQESFNKLKQMLAKLPTLAYFDPQRRTRLIADASPVALGAVLIQFDDQQIPRVISFASKSLSDVERRYSQTEKESLALVWGVERFYFYLAGLCFELVTDHKPLEAIFKPSSKPPARIERWVLRLQAFKFKIIYQPGKHNIADSISRLCQPTSNESFDRETECHIRTLIEKTVPKAVSISQVFSESKRDEQLKEAANKIENETWEATDKNPYFPFRLELTTLGPIVLRGNRIVIPESLRPHIIKLAHEGHPGETVMKRRLRAKVWWPLIDRETEKFVKACRDCLLVSKPSHPPPMMRHKFPDGPWQCLAMDLMKATEIPEEILVVIDYYSRYQEIKFIKPSTSVTIIGQLKEMFSRLGIPKSIRADNGRQFTSREFHEFCEHNNIKVIHTPPYWPQANGEVENMNRAILKRLQISHAANRDYKAALQEFTLMYNVTPHGTTGKSPSELLYGRNIRDKIPSIADLCTEHMDEEAYEQDLLNKGKGKEREDTARGAREVDIRVGDKVLIKNVIVPNKLTTTFGEEAYEVLQRTGNELVLENGRRVIRRHVGHAKKIPDPATVTPQQSNSSSTIPTTTATETSQQTMGMQDQQNLQGNATNPGELTETNKVPESTQSTKMVEPLKLERKGGMWRPVVTDQ